MPVRLATLDDADELIRLATIMFEAVGIATDDPTWEAAGRDRLRIGTADDTVRAFVVGDPHVPQRCAAAAVVSLQLRMPTPPNPRGLTAYVQWVATDPEHRRRGYARALMNAIIEWSSAKGAGSVDLHASTEGDALYRDLGFVTSRNPELRYFY